MKILLLGKSGMLGSMFQSKLSDVQALGREDLDICDFKAMKRVFANAEPELVINCCAYTAVDQAEVERDLAMKVNGEAVGEMAKLCNEHGASLVHFSTDYVFDGSGDGYAEDEVTGPLNVYGESKLLGEQLAQENCERVFIVRTSWLFGPGGGNFVDTMLKLGTERDELSIVGDQVGSPTYTADLVDAVLRNFIKGSAGPGIYHLTNSGTCSWFEFAKYIFEVTGIDVAVKKVTSEEFKRAAERPKCSILRNNKLPELRNWREAVQDYLDI